MDGSDFKMPAQVRFKGVNIYSAGNLVMSLVPARQDMNTGMYDTISQ